MEIETERDLVRRLLEHVEDGTTSLAPRERDLPPGNRVQDKC